MNVIKNTYRHIIFNISSWSRQVSFIKLIGFSGNETFLLWKYVSGCQTRLLYILFANGKKQPCNPLTARWRLTTWCLSLSISTGQFRQNKTRYCPNFRGSNQSAERLCNFVLKFYDLGTVKCVNQGFIVYVTW